MPDATPVPHLAVVVVVSPLQTDDLVLGITYLFSKLTLPTPSVCATLQSVTVPVERAVAVFESEVVSTAVRAVSASQSNSFTFHAAVFVLARVADLYSTVWTVTVDGNVPDSRGDAAIRRFADEVEPIVVVLLSGLSPSSVAAGSSVSSVGSAYFLPSEQLDVAVAVRYVQLAVCRIIAVPSRRAKSASIRLAAVTAGAVACIAHAMALPSVRVRVAMVDLAQALALSEEAVVAMGSSTYKLVPTWLSLLNHGCLDVRLAVIRGFSVFFRGYDVRGAAIEVHGGMPERGVGAVGGGWGQRSRMSHQPCLCCIVASCLQAHWLDDPVGQRSGVAAVLPGRRAGPRRRGDQRNRLCPGHADAHLLWWLVVHQCVPGPGDRPRQRLDLGRREWAR